MSQTSLKAFEQALAAHRDALKIYPLDSFPRQHSLIQLDLGRVYVEHIAGSRRENLDAAIACFQAALQVLTFDRFPEDYAVAQTNLGTAYQERIAGNRQENVEAAIACYQAALQVYTLDTFPMEFRNTQLGLASLAFEALATEAVAQNDRAGIQTAYEYAHEAYMGIRQVQVELSWLESDEQGRAGPQGQDLAIRELYVRDAWCLWQLGQRSEAMVALEAGRAQALAATQTIAGTPLKEVCPEHKTTFLETRRILEEAQQNHERTLLLSAHDAFLRVRQAIRDHCQPDFLPGEPTFEDILRAAAPEQALVYVAATDHGGLALILPPSRGGNIAKARLPMSIPLPDLTRQVVDDWLLRRNAEGKIMGGLQISLEHAGVELLT